MLRKNSSNSIESARSCLLALLVINIFISDLVLGSSLLPSVYFVPIGSTINVKSCTKDSIVRVNVTLSQISSMLLPSLPMYQHYFAYIKCRIREKSSSDDNCLYFNTTMKGVVRCTAQMLMRSIDGKLLVQYATLSLNYLLTLTFHIHHQSFWTACSIRRDVERS